MFFYLFYNTWHEEAATNTASTPTNPGEQPALYYMVLLDLSTDGVYFSPQIPCC
jgi:hypothetical protein